MVAAIFLLLARCHTTTSKLYYSKKLPLAVGDIVELDSETLFYIIDDDHYLKGVGDQSGIEFADSGPGMLDVIVKNDNGISKENFQRLCIAWLALNYPDVLKEDETPNIPK